MCNEQFSQCDISIYYSSKGSEFFHIQTAGANTKHVAALIFNNCAADKGKCSIDPTQKSDTVHCDASGHENPQHCLLIVRSWHRLPSPAPPLQFPALI